MADPVVLLPMSSCLQSSCVSPKRQQGLDYEKGLPGAEDEINRRVVL